MKVAFALVGFIVAGGSAKSQTMSPYCFPGVGGQTPCPCNNPSSPPNGCNNSANTGGAFLDATGNRQVSNDTVVFQTVGETPNALSIVLQGTQYMSLGAIYGQGVRCMGGTLKRLYTKQASSGSITSPSGSEPSVSQRSAQLGDPYNPPTTRYYLVYYRDPVVPIGCPSTATFNCTESGSINWIP